jgi:hypothetical protein
MDKMIKTEIARIIELGDEAKCKKAFESFLGLDEYDVKDKYSELPVEVDTENGVIAVMWRSRHEEENMNTYKTWAEALKDCPCDVEEDALDSLLAKLKAIQ